MLQPGNEITDGFDLLLDLIEQRAASMTTARNGNGQEVSKDPEVTARELRTLEQNKKLAERLRLRWMRCLNSLADMPPKDDERNASGYAVGQGRRTRLSLRSNR